MRKILEFLFLLVRIIFPNGHEEQPKEGAVESFLKLLEQLQGMDQVIKDLMAKLADSENVLKAEKEASFNEGKSVGDNEGFSRGEAEGYARGYEEGKASVECPVPEPVPNPNPDLKYTQEDLDNAVKNAVEPLQMRISELEVLVSEIPSKIEAAKNEIKAEIRAKYEESQSKENEAEGSFAEFLK